LIIKQAAVAGKSSIKGGKKLVSCREESGTGKVTLQFADGSSEGDFDMVFGADGIASAVSVACNGGRYDEAAAVALSSGLRISYALTGPDPTFKLRGGKTSKGVFHQWFGDGCYALAASYGGTKGPQHMLAVVYRDSNNEVVCSKTASC